MLKTDHLTITTYKGRVLLNDFSFVLNKKDKIALIGEEGNGKSTILKIIAGIDTDSYVTYTGKIICDEKIGFLPQSIEEKYLDLSVSDFISKEIDYNFLYSLLKRINIDPELIGERKLRTLSGGEKVRVSLLKLLYEQPDILLLDEPTNDLDLKTLIWLEEFISNADQAMIFVSHDETLLENCAQGILHLEQLKRKSEAHMTYSGCGYREYCESRDAYIGRNNMIASKEKNELKKQMERWRKIYQKVEYQQKTISRGDPHGAQLLKKKMHAVKAQEKILENRKENLRQKYEPEETIDVFFGHVDINPNKVILDLHLYELKIEDNVLSRNIDLKILGKDKVCLIGDNGSGKSTLIKLIAQELLQREDIKAGYMPQNYYEVMDYELTPVQFLWDGADMKKRAEVQSCLGALKFTTEEMEHKIADLSEGQKCKILLISLILNQCNVLILDEPTRNLSPLSNPIIRKILNDYEGTIISVSHDRKFIDEVADKVYELDISGLRLWQ